MDAPTTDVNKVRDPYLAGVWVPCELCEDYVCVRHHQHVADCDCPPLEEWITDGN